jgi:hypothetical protein
MLEFSARLTELDQIWQTYWLQEHGHLGCTAT